MPYVRPFLKLTLSGTLGVSEQFSYGLHMIGPVAEAPDEVPQAVIDACATFFPFTSASNAHLKTIKLNAIGVDGKYLNDTTVFYDFPGQGLAGTGSPRYPYQIALACSLMSTADRGRASKGRFYVPSPAFAAGASDMTLTTIDRDNVLAILVAFINALNDATEPFEVGLVSNLGTGRESIVSRVRVGVVFDTIRSRRNKIPENYGAAAVVEL